MKMTQSRNRPQIDAVLQRWTQISPSHFFHASDGSVSEKGTSVSLMVTETDLHVKFECRDNPYWSANTYAAHNTDLWRQEVFELFIAPGSDTPKQYIELEINPLNALFIARVDNLSGMRPEQLHMISYQDCGIRHHVTTGENRWSGEIAIPRSLIGDPATQVYRLNCYRIVLKTPQANPGWECTPETCDFLCMSPTFSGAEPAFHRPAHFDLMTVTEQ